MQKQDVEIKKMKSPSTLYLVATPIGNLEDISLRAIKTLQSVDLIACEDTRHSLKLLNHLGISKPLLSFYSQNQQGRIPQLLEKLQGGESIALISDAGTPGISDPGTLLVKACIDEGIPVVPIPGACAAIAALCASGLPTDRFYFQGFLPLKPSKKRKTLEALKALEATLVIYEAGNRMSGLMREIAQIFPESRVVIGRELSKIYEEFLRGSPAELCERIPREGLKGECVVLISTGS